MTPTEYLAFATPEDLSAWLGAHHAKARELWVRIYKKQSGTPSVTWQDCVVAGLIWGWIDGQKQSLDDASFLQRLTPRRPKSNWSQKNREHAEALIAAGRMQPAGLVHVEAAKSDGRWDTAYAGSSAMTLPDDFLAALNADADAQAAYQGLTRAELFSIYHKLQTVKRPETRTRFIAGTIEKLRSGKP